MNPVPRKLRDGYNSRMGHFEDHLARVLASGLAKLVVVTWTVEHPLPKIIQKRCSHDYKMVDLYHTWMSGWLWELFHLKRTSILVSKIYVIMDNRWYCNHESSNCLLVVRIGGRSLVGGSSHIARARAWTCIWRYRGVDRERGWKVAMYFAMKGASSTAAVWFNSRSHSHLVLSIIEEHSTLDIRWISRLRIDDVSPGDSWYRWTLLTSKVSGLKAE